MFSVCIGIALFICVILLFRQLKKLSVSPDMENLVMQSVAFTFISGVAGGYFLDLLLRGCIEALFINPAGYGLTFYGWLIGAMIFLLFYAHCQHIPKSFLMNLFLPAFALAQAIGRIGCFLGGCCYGRPVAWGGVSYPAGSLPYIHFGSTPLVPVQLYESAYLIIIFLLLLFAVRFKKRGAWYLILMPSGRFFLEFLRADDRGFVLDHRFSPSQYISCVLFICGIIWLARIKLRRNYCNE